ncbi:MAG: SusC/RagA family TonB-linked outer membrane protein [bacterium]
MMLLALTAPATAQDPTGTISGVVTDQGGQPIPAAQVTVVGTQRSTAANRNGEFSIANVPAGEQRVRATALGYRAETMTAQVGAGETVTLEFRLEVSAIALDEVVVTGTVGGVERRALGNVVSNIRAQDVMELAPVPDVQSLINARAPGVVITPGTGMAGSGSQIRIRGSSSISLSNTPLLYVDGVRVDNAQNSGPAAQAFGSSVISRLNDFNPDDIESIEIIKGPAAATLYGTEAANGVIQIVTRRGRDADPTWNLTVRQGASWFRNAEERVPTNWWRDPDTGDIHSINFAQSEAERGQPLWRTGHNQTYNLSLTGGTPDLRYHISGYGERDEGADWDNRVRRYGTRANLTVVASPTTEVTGTLGYTRGDFALACEAGCGGVTWASYFSTPAHAQGDDRRRGARSFTPEFYWNVTDRTQDLARFTGSIQVNQTPADWFRHRLVLGLDDTRENNQTLTEISPILLEWSPTALGGKSVGRREVTNQTVDYNGTFNVDLQSGLTSSTSFGGQYYYRKTEFVSADGSEFALPGLRVVSATAETSASESFVEEVSLGLFVQQEFNSEDRRFLTLGLRADDHSAFGQNFDLVYYPKVSATWVITEEPFWNLDAIGDLRLRTAFGRAGEQPGAFDALRTFSAVAGPGDEATVTPGGVGNAELGPERGEEFEVGFDAGFLDGRAGLEFTYYNQNTRDAILLQPVSPSTGFPGSRFVNVGEISNFGLEASLNVQPVVTPSATWDLTLSMARNDSEIQDLGEEDRIVESSAFGVEHRVGFPIASWFHRRVVDADFDAEGQVIQDSMMCDDGEGGTTPCFEDGSLVAPLVHLGRSEPLHEGSVSSTVTLFDRLRIYGLVDFKTGFKKWDHVNRVRCSLFNTCRENVEPEEFIDDDPGRVASYQFGGTFGAEYIRDSSFFRLRELSVSYQVPEEFAQRVGASRATVTLSGRNLGEWTDWTGMDPEARFLGGARGNFGGVEQNHLPQLTRFVTSINLSF